MQNVEMAEAKKRPTRFLMEELSQESLLTKEKYGSVDRIYIMCEDDDVLKRDFQRRMIENYQPKEVKVISGADHQVMLSKPEELCQTLEDIALKYY